MLENKSCLILRCTWNINNKCVKSIMYKNDKLLLKNMKK